MVSPQFDQIYIGTEILQKIEDIRCRPVNFKWWLTIVWGLKFPNVSIYSCSCTSVRLPKNEGLDQTWMMQKLTLTLCIPRRYQLVIAFMFLQLIDPLCNVEATANRNMAMQATDWRRYVPPRAYLPRFMRQQRRAANSQFISSLSQH